MFSNYGSWKEMAKIRGALTFFCLASLLALVFMVGGGVGEQIANGYLRKRMYINALLCYSFTGWLVDLLAAFSLFVSGWLSGRYSRGRSSTLKALGASAVLIWAAVLYFFVDYNPHEGLLHPIRPGFWGLSILIAVVVFLCGLSSDGSNRLLAWADRWGVGFIVVGVAALIFPATVGAARFLQGRAPKGPNVLLISIDTLRADHLGCYGYHKRLTPNIDEFAKESVVFRNAIATSPWTLPSHVSMLTGHLSSLLGVRSDDDKLSPAVSTLAELLREQGYLTASFNGGGFVGASYGFDQGFDTFFSLYSDRPSSKYLNEIEAINKFTMRFLTNNKGKKSFIFYHTYQVHAPYLFHEGFSERGADECKDAYDLLPECHIAYEGEVEYMDSHVGKLFDFLKERGLYDDTLIILTADHGEDFVEDKRGMAEHGYLLYDELIKVPLIIRFPSGAFGGKAIGTQVSLVDVVPTVMDVLGIEGGFGGESLMPIVRGTEEDDRPALAEYYPRRRAAAHYPHLNYYKLSLRFSDRKLIVKSKQHGHELYDLAADPRETTNLLANPSIAVYSEALEMFARLSFELDRKRAGVAAIGGRGEKAEMTPELHEQLKALGYVQ